MLALHLFGSQVLAVKSQLVIGTEGIVLRDAEHAVDGSEHHLLLGLASLPKFIGVFSQLVVGLQLLAVQSV